MYIIPTIIPAMTNNYMLLNENIASINKLNNLIERIETELDYNTREDFDVVTLEYEDGERIYCFITTSPAIHADICDLLGV